MTRPPDDAPTTVLPQQTVEQPSVTTSPATRRTHTWHRRIPARIGRARSSTVIIGVLFVLLGGLNLVLPEEDTGTTPVTTSDGRTVLVPNSALPSEARSTPAPATSAPAEPTQAPETSAPASTSRAPRTTADEEETTTPTRSSAAEETATPSTSADRTSSSRSTATSAPSTSEAPSTPTSTSTPTG